MAYSLLSILNALYKSHLRGHQIHLAIFLIIHHKGYASTREIVRLLPAVSDEAIRKNITRLLAMQHLISIRHQSRSGKVFNVYALSPSGQQTLLQFLSDIDNSPSL